MIPRGLLIVMAASFSVSPFDGVAAPDPAPLAAGPAAAMAGTGDTGSGVIAGRVSFSGTAPPLRSVKLSADPRCAAIHKGGLQYQPVKVKQGGLADVLVYVKSGIGASYPVPAEPVMIDQVGCEYDPSMVVVMVGQPLRIRNNDDTLHNIHPRPTVNKEFNVGQPRKGMEITKTFEKPELMIPIGCDVHPWMRAHVSVLAHPFFAVTKEDGSYEIRGLPDGEYEVEAVHGQLGSVTGKVTVKDGKASPLNLTLKG
jgi:plastocyanin